MSKLRDYQQRDFEKILKIFEKENSCLYQLPTGGGKSLLIEHVIIENKNKKILILAHKRELIFQMEKRLKSNNLNPGVIIGSIEENIDSNIIIASIRTVTRDKRIQTILDKKFDYIVIDEAHHIRSPSYEKVLDLYKEHNPDMKLFGVTATPYRNDKKSLEQYFTTLLCSNDVPELQKEGYLSQFRVFYTPTPNIKDEVESNSNDYQITSLSQYMKKDEMLQFAVDSYIKEGNNEQMIVFCVDKSHAKLVISKYKENGYKNIAYIDSETKLEDRKKILSDFALGLIQIIVCIETLTEGVDLPETKCIQLLRPTKSLNLYLQMVGRGARIKSDGSSCLILDNAGCSLEHKMPNSRRSWSLDPNIDPNEPTLVNKIIGKRKNGTFTDDEEEMAFLELIEVTPEEYLMNIEGGIEKSENFNKDIDNEVKLLTNNLGSYIISLVDNKLIYDERETTGYYSRIDSIYLKHPNLNHSKIKVRLENGKVTIGNETYNSHTDKYDFYIVLGKLANEINKPKINQKIVSEFKNISHTKSKIIDIEEFKRKIQDFKLEKNILKLDSYLSINNEIKLSRDVSLGSFFRDAYWGMNINILVFDKNKLQKSHNIKFYKDDKLIFEKNTKQDKILDILKFGNWKEFS